MTTKENARIVCGVDVASAELVCRISVDTKVLRYKNTPKGVSLLLDRIKSKGVTLVVLEHTGRYERLLVNALWDAEVPVHCAHPKASHNFAKALRANAKSDPIDAGILMEYGLTMNLTPTERLAPEILELQEYSTRRDDLNEALVQEKNRLKAPGIPEWKVSSISNHIRFIEKELNELEANMRKLVDAHPSLKQAIECLCREHGVGFISAAALYAHVPELGTVNRQRIAALVGVAPFIRQSGNYQGQSRIYGGRTEARTALYMPTLAVIRKKGHPLRDFYCRLKSSNKSSNEAIIAVMRKLLIRLNTAMKAQRIDIAAVA